MGGAKHTSPPPIFLNGGSDTPRPPPPPFRRPYIYICVCVSVYIYTLYTHYILIHCIYIYTCVYTHICVFVKSNTIPTFNVWW